MVVGCPAGDVEQWLEETCKLVEVLSQKLLEDHVERVDFIGSRKVTAAKVEDSLVDRLLMGIRKVADQLP